MLRWLDFDDSAVLDGGYDKWVADGRAVSTSPCTYTAGTLSVAPRPELFVGKEKVLAAIGRSDTCFLLHQLGYRDVAVYDNSMSEWATDETLPIETN